MTETITTAEARDALPPGVIVRSAAGTIACRHDGGMGVCFGVERPFAWDQLALPLTVLYRPDQPTPTVKPCEKDIIEAMVSAAPEVYAERGAVWFEAKAADVRASAGPYARAVLALLPGRTVDEVKAEALREYATARYRAYLEDPEIPWFDQPSRLAQQYAKSLDELLAEADRIEAGGE